MTDHELQLLAIGAALGMNVMLLIQVGFGILDDRRDRKAARDAEARLDAARSRMVTETLADLRERSEPHPAELLEASVRGFELNLHDAIDRVDDALRRDGQL